MSHRLSIIIPNWNGCLFFFELFSSLERCRFDPSCQIIVVDNGSSDASAELVRDFYPEIVLILNSANKGFAAAVNRGIQAADGEYIAILNNDISWKNDWLEDAVQFLDNHSAYDFAAPLVMNYFRRDLVDSAGDGINRFFMPYKIGHGLPPQFSGENRQELISASCSAVVFRSTFFQRIGAFDEDFFMYLEDVDLFLRGFLKGSTGRLLGDARVFHREGGSINRLEIETGTNSVCTRKSYFLVRNRLYLLFKNCPSGYVFLFWPFLLFEFIRSAVHHMSKGESLLFLKAHLDGIRNIKIVMSKRRIIQRHRWISLKHMIRSLR